jgi:hypothetical protein
MLADPRLARDVPAREFPDLAAAASEKWAHYWRKWPLAHLAGAGDGARRAEPLFRLEGDRIEPSFVIDDALGDVFDAMVAEIIEYRLASYVLNKETSTTRSWSCRLTFTDGHPAIRLDRRQYPDLPEGTLSFVADGIDFDASFSKGAIATASRRDSTGNALPGLLRGWFGPSAGHPGTSHRVSIEQVEGTLLIQPDHSADAEVPIDYVPLFGDYTVAAVQERKRLGLIMPRRKSRSEGLRDKCLRRRRTSCASPTAIRWTADPTPLGTAIPCSSNGLLAARPATT